MIEAEERGLGLAFTHRCFDDDEPGCVRLLTQPFDYGLERVGSADRWEKLPERPRSVGARGVPADAPRKVRSERCGWVERGPDATEGFGGPRQPARLHLKGAGPGRERRHAVAGLGLAQERERLDVVQPPGDLSPRTWG